jgi:hypothetical protein
MFVEDIAKYRRFARSVQLPVHRAMGAFQVALDTGGRRAGVRMREPVG